MLFCLCDTVRRDNKNNRLTVCAKFADEIKVNKLFAAIVHWIKRSSAGVKDRPREKSLRSSAAVYDCLLQKDLSI